MNESSRPDEQIVDDTVRRVYRESAAETVPEHLNRRVLNEAGYAATLNKGRRWPAFRPLAWAATVGLSLVLVMQVTTLGPEPPPVSESPDYDAAGDLPAPELLRDRLGEVAPAAISPDEKRERLDSSTTMSAPAQGSRRVGKDRETAAGLAQQESAANGVPGQAFSVAPASSDAAAAALPSCDDEQRRDPESWQQCIVDLLDAGHRDGAIAEYLRYREAFPEAPPIDL